MKRIAIVTALFLALAGTMLPAGAAQWVQDGAGLFSPATVSSLTSQLDDFNRQTGKQIYVITVASLNGQTIDASAERAFAQNQVNGVMFYIAKNEHQLGIYPDRASRQWFPSGTLANVRSVMLPYFKNGDYDQGIKTGVNLVLDTYRSHLGSLKRTSSAAGTVPAVQTAPVQRAETGGFSMSWIWWLLILLAGFLILRAIFRAMAGPRIYPPGYGGPMQGGPMGGAPMGGPGYGPGYGGPMGGGGGGFWSGLLGGLGGAFIGNELFGRGGAFGGGGTTEANVIDPGAAAGTPVDNSGWQNDAGQIDMGNSSSGDFGGGGGGGWGDSGGGGFDSGGGGGDFGGGGDSSSW